ncbi:type I restriction enzyme S subunit [Streptomyces avidinii]|uniref:restriction endonuclease subunit S n=2 Tax=Streptomyces TaxID=1883 RepID=UPI000BDB46D5|nr:type I restriction enzyme S subunit [Streptomyces avidinii]SNX78666.1 type I restriction enzyme, S subunit [Streptomyces microflavus]
MNTVRLRHLAQINPLTPAFDRLADEDELTFIPMEAVWPGNRLDISRRRTKSTVATGYTRFQNGDVLVPKITPTFEAGRAVLIDGLLGGVGAGTTELHIVRPGPEIDPKYLLYTVNTHNFLKLGAAEMYGVAGQQRVPDDFLRDLPVRLPPLVEQRRIADFLDAETARIDALVDATKSQQGLVIERRDVAFHESVREEDGPDLNTLDLNDPGPGWQILALNRVLRQLTNGYVGPTRDLFVDDGVPYLQSLHVKNGRIDFARRPYFVPPEWAAARPRISLSHEDLLIVQTGGIGEVGIIDDNFVGASCHALLIARTRRDLLLPTYLWHAFRSHWGRHALLREQTGALHPHLEAGNVRFMKLPVPSLDTQERIVARTEAVARDTQVIHTSLVRRLALQAERRQALITAAVTGQFDVSTASGRNVTDGVPT